MAVSETDKSISKTIYERVLQAEREAAGERGDGDPAREETEGETERANDVHNQ